VVHLFNIEAYSTYNSHGRLLARSAADVNGYNRSLSGGHALLIRLSVATIVSISCLLLWHDMDTIMIAYATWSYGILFDLSWSHRNRYHQIFNRSKIRARSLFVITICQNTVYKLQLVLLDGGESSLYLIFGLRVTSRHLYILQSVDTCVLHILILCSMYISCVLYTYTYTYTYIHIYIYIYIYRMGYFNPSTGISPQGR